jgi:hypothetical protein
MLSQSSRSRVAVLRTSASLVMGCVVALVVVALAVVG